MSKTTSLFLDLLRAGAALMVVFGHFTNPLFCTVFPNLQIYAVCAVSVFFVLSGYVISYVADKKEKDPVSYSAARFGRLYSVLVPALVVTLLIELIIWNVDRGYFSVLTKGYIPIGVSHSGGILRSTMKSLAPLTFLSEVHGFAGFPALDGPMWSIGYEAAYYAVFGIALYVHGLRRILLLLIACFVIGIDILRLMPVWVAGVALYRVTRKEPKWLKRKLPGISCIFVILMQCVLWPGVKEWNFNSHGPAINHILHGHLFSSDAFLYYYWGAATVLGILAVIIMDDTVARLLSPFAKPIRWFAAHTFSLYLFHYPILALLYAVTHYNRASIWQSGLAFIATLALCIVFSSFSEPTKFWWRAKAHFLLLKLFPQEEASQLVPNLARPA